MRRLAGAVLVAALVAVLAVVCAGTALAAVQPHWYILTRSAPTRLSPGVKGAMVSQIVNFGQSAVQATEADPVVISDKLPAHVLATAVHAVARLGADYEPVEPGEAPQQIPLSCEPVTTPVSEIQCKFVGTLPPYVAIVLEVPAEIEAGGSLPASEQNVVEVTGGGAQSAKAQARAPAGDTGGFGVEQYELRPETESGEVDTQAGSHPFQMTSTLAFNEGYGAIANHGEKGEHPTVPALVRNVNTTLPAGLVGNTKLVHECSAVAFSSVPTGNFNNCPGDTAIGVAIVTARDPNGFGFSYFTETIPVFNLETGPGEPARLGFEFEKVPITLDTSVKTGEGYAVQVSSTNTPTSAELMSAIVTVWGVPGSSAHALARGWECVDGGDFRGKADPHAKSPRECEEQASTKAQAPYLTLPTRCESPADEPGALTSTVEAQAWGESSFTPGPSSTLTLTGCGSLPFAGAGAQPRLLVSPFTHDASTPTGLEDTIEVPQSSTLEPVLDESVEPGKAEADISKTVLTLPAGVLSNAGLANGLEACAIATAGFGAGLFPGAVGALESALREPSFASDFEARLEGELNALTGEAFESRLASELSSQQFTPEPTQAHVSGCQPAAKIGRVKIVSPILKEPIEGSLYLGKQNTNPFRSALVLYLMAFNQSSGIRVKLAGEVKIQEDGELVSTFAGTPPVPFEKLEVVLPNEENGERAANSTPAQCGEYSSEATFTTFFGTGTTTVHSDPAEFAITAGPGGSPCPLSPLAFQPSFAAGPTVKQAGALTPFTTTIGHADGQQAIRKIDLQLPPGVAALISQVTPCPQASAEANPNACGPESLVGYTTSVSGLGGKPVTLKGQLYLTGELKANAHHGASPFGLLAVTHALAGPFDLGDVDVLSTIDIDESTAAASISSEPIPRFVEGVPAQLKLINVTVERPGNQPFQFNPTNCEELKLTGTLSGWEGAQERISEPFFVTGCASLPFTPKLTASAAAQGSKSKGTTFKVTVESAGLGQANIHKVDLTLPAQLPSRQSTIEKACLDSVFEANPASCAEGSVIGEGIVRTPVFKNPLRGPAYLVSHGAAKFPDVEFVLQGEGVTVLLDGETDIKKGITYSKFETSPDVPFTRFESIFPEGPHSALTTYVPELENYNLCKHSLSIPTEITGQDGAFVSHVTPVVLVGCRGVKGVRLRRKQELAKALKACRKHKRKRTRAPCERAARKKYGPRKHAKKARKH